MEEFASGDQGGKEAEEDKQFAVPGAVEEKEEDRPQDQQDQGDGDRIDIRRFPCGKYQEDHGENVLHNQDTDGNLPMQGGGFPFFFQDLEGKDRTAETH